MAGRQMARLACGQERSTSSRTCSKARPGALVVEDVHVDPGSPLVGMSIREMQERVPHAVFIAVRHEGQILSPPAPDFRLASGDMIAAVGIEANLRLLEGYSQSTSRLAEGRDAGGSC